MSQEILSKKYAFKRGDTFQSGRFIFESPAGAGSAFWANPVVASQIRDKDEALVQEFTPTITVTEEDGVGIITIECNADPADTQAWPVKTLHGDVEVSSDQFPKRTLAELEIAVSTDWTHE
jgi:hypothetical protein